MSKVLPSVLFYDIETADIYQGEETESRRALRKLLEEMMGINARNVGQDTQLATCDVKLSVIRGLSYCLVDGNKIGNAIISFVDGDMTPMSDLITDVINDTVFIKPNELLPRFSHLIKHLGMQHRVKGHIKKYPKNLVVTGYNNAKFDNQCIIQYTNGEVLNLLDLNSKVFRNGSCQKFVGADIDNGQKDDKGKAEYADVRVVDTKIAHDIGTDKGSSLRECAKIASNILHDKRIFKDECDTIVNYRMGTYYIKKTEGDEITAILHQERPIDMTEDEIRYNKQDVVANVGVYLASIVQNFQTAVLSNTELGEIADKLGLSLEDVASDYYALKLHNVEFIREQMVAISKTQATTTAISFHAGIRAKLLGTGTKGVDITPKTIQKITSYGYQVADMEENAETMEVEHGVAGGGVITVNIDAINKDKSEVVSFDLSSDYPDVMLKYPRHGHAPIPASDPAPIAEWLKRRIRAFKALRDNPELYKKTVVPHIGDRDYIIYLVINDVRFHHKTSRCLTLADKCFNPYGYETTTDAKGRSHKSKRSDYISVCGKVYSAPHGELYVDVQSLYTLCMDYDFSVDWEKTRYYDCGRWKRQYEFVENEVVVGADIKTRAKRIKKTVNNMSASNEDPDVIFKYATENNIPLDRETYDAIHDVKEASKYISDITEDWYASQKVYVNQLYGKSYINPMRTESLIENGEIITRLDENGDPVITYTNKYKENGERTGRDYMVGVNTSAWGRAQLVTIFQAIRKYYPAWEVVYGHTDSVKIHHIDNTTTTLEECEDMLAFLNTLFDFETEDCKRNGLGLLDNENVYNVNGVKKLRPYHHFIVQGNAQALYDDPKHDAPTIKATHLGAKIEKYFEANKLTWNNTSIKALSALLCSGAILTLEGDDKFKTTMVTPQGKYHKSVYLENVGAYAVQSINPICWVRWLPNGKEMVDTLKQCDVDTSDILFIKE